MNNLERYGWPALACLLFSAAHADGTGRHSVMLSVQGDTNDNRQWLGRLVLPLGDYAWLQGSVGNTELATAPAATTRTVGAAAGAGGRTIQTAVAFTRRTSDAGFEQQDWAATLDWRGQRGGLGVDGFLRSARGESQMTAPDSLFSPPATTTFTQSVDSRGFGLHGDFDLTPRAKVFAGAMRYRHDFNVESTAIGDRTPLSALFGQRSALSGLWREQAFIDRSYRIGGSFRLQSAALSAQYFNDRIANSAETLGTLQLQAEFLIAGHWLLSPSVGHSSGATESASFGGLSVAFTW